MEQFNLNGGGIVFPIRDTYVAHWSLYEAVREIIQNGKDEEEQHGHALRVEWRDGVLAVTNVGATLDPTAFLLGQTGKAEDPSLRGRFGEGLNLALLVAAREGFAMTLASDGRVWTPAIEPVVAFGGARCLVVRSAPITDTAKGVEVRLAVSAAEWERVRSMFLFLDAPENVIETRRGRLLLDRRFLGMVFVKGIFVTRLKDASFGYDLAEAKLDRDRRMLDIGDMRWTLSAIVRDAMERDGGKEVVGTVLGMLDRELDEVRVLTYQINQGDKSLAALTEQFAARHGADAFPVRTVAESQKLASLGKRGVVVSESLATILSKQFGTADEVTDRLRTEARSRRSWHDLGIAEQDALVRAAGLIERATGDQILDRLQVVEFGDDALLGLCDLGTGAIQLSAKALVDFPVLVRVLIHELAHAKSGAGDGTKQHVDTIEEIWTAVLKQTIGGAS
jgi:hypothetical protein